MQELDIAEVARRSGLPASALRLMFGPDGRPRIDRASLTAKADDLDRTIRRLSVMRDGLRHAAVCSAPSHMECSHFRRLILLAGAGRLGAPKGRGNVPRKRAAS